MRTSRTCCQGIVELIVRCLRCVEVQFETEVNVVVEERASKMEEVSIDETQIQEGSYSLVAGMSWNRIKDMREELGREGGKGRCVR